jgi:hypothetical protein
VAVLTTSPVVGPDPLTLSGDTVVRHALTGYLGAVVARLRAAGHRVSGPTLARPEEPLTGSCTLTESTIQLMEVTWSEETGWSARCERPCLARGMSPRHYLHLSLIPAPAIAAAFITTVLQATGTDGQPEPARLAAAVGRAGADYPQRFRYRSGRAEHLLTRLTRATPADHTRCPLPVPARRQENR